MPEVLLPDIHQTVPQAGLPLRDPKDLVHHLEDWTITNSPGSPFWHRPGG